MRRYFFVPLFAALLFGASGSNGGEGVGSTAKTRTVTTEQAVSGARPRTFTLDQAILTALQHNPSIQNAKQEIERSKGVILQIGAEALPHITPNASLEWTSPGLAGSFGGTTTIR